MAISSNTRIQSSQFDISQKCAELNTDEAKAKSGESTFETITALANLKNIQSEASIKITPNTRSCLLKSMSDNANSLALNLAGTALKTHTSWADAITNISTSKHLRRGKNISPEAFTQRSNFFQGKISEGQVLQFAILMLPCRDKNIVKNPGCSPDLGEAFALSRAYAFIKAANLCRESIQTRYQNNMILLFDTQDLKSCETKFDEILSKKDPNKTYDFSFDIQNVKKQLKSNQKRSHLFKLIDEIKENYQILDKDKLSHLLKTMCDKGITFSSIIEGRNLQGKSAVLHVVQDPERYASFDNEPKNEHKTYSTELKAMSHELGYDKDINITSHAELESTKNSTELQEFKNTREGEFLKIQKQLQDILIPAKSDLLSAENRDQFYEKLEHAIDNSKANGSVKALIDKVPSMVEPMMFSMYFPDIAQLTEKSEDKVALDFYAHAFTPNTANIEENTTRQQYLWRSLMGAVDYISSYAANTRDLNSAKIDDIDFLLPQSIRFSIHEKTNFTTPSLRIGPNIHRTPWHGVTCIDLDNNKSNITIRLNYEAKALGYSPISTSSNNQPFMYIKGNAISEKPHIDQQSQILNSVKAIRI